MAWLRVDDGLAEHRKLLALKRSDRWTWVELLCYVARQNNGGHIPSGICTTMRYVTPSFLTTCEDAGLLDRDDNGVLVVHDWADYNPKDPTGADRQRRYRRNGGKRDT